MSSKSKKPIALSLFSGAGGMDIGVSEAGFNILACIEYDPNCCATLRENQKRKRNKSIVIEDDIRNIDPKDLMKQLGLKPGELDLLFGGPPCQAFSQIGKQDALNDERGLLLFEMIRFAEVFKPKAMLVEQVKGLLSARGHNNERGEVFSLFLKKIESLNYISKWKVLNSADYGVPQLRERVFVVACPMSNGFNFPAPTHGDPTRQGSLFNLPAYNTVGQVLKGLGRPSLKNGKPRPDSHVDVTPEGDKRRIHGVPEGEWLAKQTHLPKEQIGRLGKKDTTKYLRLSRKKPSKTLRCGEIFFHPLSDRYLTPREYMQIHCYPSNYKLVGPIRSRTGVVKNLDQHRQVANSVPPPVAMQLAKQVKKVLDAQGL